MKEGSCIDVGVFFCEPIKSSNQFKVSTFGGRGTTLCVAERSKSSTLITSSSTIVGKTPSLLSISMDKTGSSVTRGTELMGETLSLAILGEMLSLGDISSFFCRL